MERDIVVSVIIPVFNVAPFLAEALDSVCHQTYGNLEIIIIDDGSTDGSEKICDYYSGIDERIHVIHQENKGLSGARNAGLDIMTGEMVVFLDSDDSYHPDYIRTMINIISLVKADIVICRFTIHKTEEKMKINVRDKIYPSVKEGIYDRDNALRALVDGSINPGVWNKLYKSELWKNIRFPVGHVYENIDTTYRIMSMCILVCVINQPLYLYRKRIGAITDVVSAKTVNDWLLARSHFEEYIKENIPEIFSDEHLILFHRSRINQMIIFYIDLLKNKGDEEKVLREDLRNRIIEKGREIGINKCDRSTQAGYWMVCHCPGLLKFIYPVYSSVYQRIRMMDRKTK